MGVHPAPQMSLSADPGVSIVLSSGWGRVGHPCQFWPLRPEETFVGGSWEGFSLS